MSTENRKGAKRYRCDGCGKLIPQSKDFGTMWLWTTKSQKEEAFHFHRSDLCVNKMYVKVGIQLKLF